MRATAGVVTVRGVNRLRGVDARLADALLTLALAGLGLASQFASGAHDVELRDTDAVAVLLGLATTVPVYWRRRSVVALLVSVVAITAVAVAEYRLGSLPLAVLVLVYSNGAHADRPKALVGLAAPNVALLAIWLSDPVELDGAGVAQQVTIYTGAWLAGQVVRARQATTSARIAEAEERAEAQRQVAARSVAEERLRLAQELHDVVAHSMSVIAVQAGMGVHVIDQQPEEAKRALEAISQTSRTTLQEMRRLLGVLRDDEGGRSNAPAPGLAELPRLVDEVRGAGVPVTLLVEGEPEGVPHGVELSVYRLVQEGLTNVLKHAGRASATVTIRYGTGEVDVEVLDDGRGAAAAVNGSGGHGLVGMRERVGLWGGTLDAGPRTGGGYRVSARLPYGAPA